MIGVTINGSCLYFVQGGMWPPPSPRMCGLCLANGRPLTVVSTLNGIWIVLDLSFHSLSVSICIVPIRYNGLYSVGTPLRTSPLPVDQALPGY